MIPGRTSPSKRVRWLPALGLLLLAGCATPSGEAVDPLTGGPPIPANPPSSVAAAPAGSKAIPLTPAPTSTMSAAALAASSPIPGREADPRRLPDPKAPVAPAADWHGNGATLHGPQAESATVPVRATEVPRATVAIDSWQQAQDVLTSYRVVEQKLETIGGGTWSFYCKIPNPQNPKVADVFEVSKPGANGLEAIRAVILAIEKRYPDGPAPVGN